MALKLEVIIPTTRDLTEEEREELVNLIHDMIKEKLDDQSWKNFNLHNKVIINLNN